MASQPHPSWVEGSHLLSNQSGFKPNPVPWQHDGHAYSDAILVEKHDVQSHAYPMLPPPAPLTPPVHKPTLLQKLSGTWIFEILGLVVSAASLVAIVFVLRRYDGQRIPNWSLSFNTLISILAVVSKMGALYGAVNAISQLKWAWFTEHGKNLSDYKMFDGGTRGMAGAATLVWFLKGRNAAAIGALAVIIGVAAGPFAQQLVHFYDAEYTDISRTSWLARADIADTLGPKLDASTWTMDPALKANAVTALFLPTQEILTQPRFDCPTGNCTFAPFSTLAFCHTCVDVSPQLTRVCKPVENPFDATKNVQSCTVSFPGDDPLSLRYIADPDEPGSSTYMVVNQTLAANSTALGDIAWPRYIYQSIRALVPTTDLGGTLNPYLEQSGNSATNGLHILVESTPFQATECVLSPCVQRISASVSRNAYSEVVLDTFKDFLPPAYASPLILTPPWTNTPTSPPQNYTLHPEWLEAATSSSHSSTIDPLGSSLLGTVSTEDSNQAIRVSDIPQDSTQYPRANDALSSIFYANFTGTTCPTPGDNFQCAFRMLAMAMTKSVRDAGVVKNGTGSGSGRAGTGTVGREVVNGDVSATGTFIRVDWVWFALPVAVWALSLIVVVVAMWKSRGMPLWRESALPLVLLGGGREFDGRGEVKEAALAKRAETMEVLLHGDEGRGMRILTGKGGR